MSDVLSKPFTKEGTLHTLEKHLPLFTKDYVRPQQGHTKINLPISTRYRILPCEKKNHSGQNPVHLVSHLGNLEDSSVQLDKIS
jgi:hypothetical protein